MSTEPAARAARVAAHRGRRTQAAIDQAARTAFARKGIPATTVAGIAAEAGRSAASFDNYYDSTGAGGRRRATVNEDVAQHPGEIRSIPRLSVCYRAVYSKEGRSP